MEKGKIIKIDLGRKSKHSTAMAEYVCDYFDEDHPEIKDMIVVRVTEILDFKLNNPQLKRLFTMCNQIIERRQIIG